MEQLMTNDKKDKAKGTFVMGSNVEAISKIDYVTGIQRVVIESHKYLTKEFEGTTTQIKGFVASDNSRSDAFRSSPYYLSDPVMSGETTDLTNLDLVLLLDLDWGFQFNSLDAERKKRNLPVISFVYDLLPIRHPEWFPVEGVKTLFRVYLQKLVAVSDCLVFNSRYVLDDFNKLGWNFEGSTEVIHLGAFDTPARAIHFKNPERTIISVATIEPRKGQDEILDAFDFLRSKGHNYNLFFVGRYGWHSEALVDRLINHPEYGGRIRWFSSLNDAEVSALYDGSTVAVVASQGEGFGLNIEEALAHNIKVVARNLPVFTEREQPNLFFYEGDGFDLGNRILEIDNGGSSLGLDQNVRSMNDFGRDLVEIIKRFRP
jgi:glycosyltransferase involved in cell wall biosynthesis